MGSWFSMLVLAAAAGCGPGKAPIVSPIPETPDHWPVNPAGLVFLWESAAGKNEVAEGEGIRRCVAMPKGRARFFRNFEMDLGGGTFTADEYSMETLRRVLDAGGAFTLEALVTADRAQDGTVLRNGTVGVFQRGEDLVFTAAEPSPVSARIGKVAAGVPVPFAAVFEKGDWRYYLDGALVEGESTEAQGEAVEEMGLVFGGEWEGKLAGIAMYGRALAPVEIRAHANYWSARVAARPEVARVALRGKLVRVTVPPKPSPKDAYRGALAAYTYDVEEVTAGSFADERVQVLHWVVLDDKELASFPREEGASYDLEIEPYSAHRQLETYFPADTDEDFNLQIYYDVATPGP